MFCHRHHYFQWKFCVHCLFFFFCFFYLRTTYASSQPGKKRWSCESMFIPSLSHLCSHLCMRPPNRYAASDVIHRDLKSGARSTFWHSNSKPPSGAKEDRKEGDGQKETKSIYIFLWNMRRIARTLFFLALGCLLCEAGKWKEKYPIRKWGELVESFVECLNVSDIVV